MITSLTDFFHPTSNPHPTQSKIIKINIQYQTQTINSKVFLIENSTKMFFENQGHFFQLDENCKMLPLFNEQNNNTTVKQLKIYNPEKTQFCVFESLQLQDNQVIYDRLKRIISHKGFNDFYKPLKRLGRGTFATVYLIEHKFTKIKKAAKVFSFQGQKLEFKGKQALQNQIKTLRQIDHPNLVRYDGVYETDNLIYLVTEYLSGGTLEEMMKNKCVHTGEFVSNIIKDILEGLDYLDRKHIMHRDVKPENIIFRKQDEKWVIGDFGLAAKSNQQYIYSKCGTMGYIAPEIMEMNEENPKKYSQSCDIYSLVGSLPFHVESENFFDKKIVWDMFDKPECKQVHPEIINFLKKLLSKQPKDRYTSKQALDSSFFTNKSVVDGLYKYHQRRRQERYDRILKIANNQY